MFFFRFEIRAIKTDIDYKAEHNLLGNPRPEWKISLPVHSRIPLVMADFKLKFLLCTWRRAAIARLLILHWIMIDHKIFL